MKSQRLLALLGLALFLGACASANQSIQAAPPVVRPKPLAATPASQGSLFPASLGSGAPRPLFEDRRARAVGDVLQVVLRESTAANRSIGNQASRESTVNFSVTQPEVAGRSRLGNIAANSEVDFQGSGASSARNAFTGVLMVMVTQVLTNGNLVVSGEKQIAIGAEEEVIRFSGIINPADLTNNSVLSTQVADARLEYRGRGLGDDATRPGWMTRGLLKVWPF